MKKIIAFTAAVIMILSAFVFPGAAYKSYRSAAANLSNIKDGDLIYYEGFDIANTPYPESETDTKTGNKALMDVLKWKVLNTADGALTDNTVKYSIVDGRLYIDNIEGKDSYCQVLEDAKMWEVVSYGKWTLQYDVQLTEDPTEAKDRYIVMVYNYNGNNCYNSFHVRSRGTGNNQPRCLGDWFNYDSSENKSNVTETGKSIISKLTNGAVDYVEKTGALINMNMTIRIQCDASGYGPHCYMRNNDLPNSDFVLIADDGPESTGAQYWYNESKMPGFALALKPSQKIRGYIDNIYVYAGLGDVPATKITSYTALPMPEKSEIRNALSKENGGVVHIGVQEKVADGKLTVRVVGGVDSKKYEEVGYKIKVTDSTGESNRDFSTNKAYNRIYNTDEKGYSYFSTFDASYLFVAELEGLAATGTVTLEITPWNKDFEGFTKEADTFIVTYTDGVFVSQQYKPVS